MTNRTGYSDNLFSHEQTLITVFHIHTSSPIKTTKSTRLQTRHTHSQQLYNTNNKRGNLIKKKKTRKKEQDEQTKPNLLIPRCGNEVISLGAKTETGHGIIRRRDHLTKRRRNHIQKVITQNAIPLHKHEQARTSDTATKFRSFRDPGTIQNGKNTK